MEYRMPSHPRAVLGAALALVAVLPLPLDAQIRASERARVSQTVDGTTITVDYARPRARGRDPLFGGVVHWGEVWTPGANWATTLEVDKDITLAGHPVPAGVYSMWMTVEPGNWEVVLDPEAKLFHTTPPAASDEQIRFSVTPAEGEPVEALAFYFPEYAASGTELRMHWGTTYVAMEIGVEASQRMTVTDAEAAPILGEYRMTMIFGAPEGQDPPVVPYDVYRGEDGSMRVKTSFGPEWPPGMELMLLPTPAEGIFIPGLLVDGEFTDTLTETFMEFLIENGRAVSFEFRGDDDTLYARGGRSAS
jgi:Protein of unknown function (DUF2911)